MEKAANASASFPHFERMICDQGMVGSELSPVGGPGEARQSWLME